MGHNSLYYFWWLEIRMRNNPSSTAVIIGQISLWIMMKKNFDTKQSYLTLNIYFCFSYSFFPFLSLTLSHSFNLCVFYPLLIDCLFAAFLLDVWYLSCFPVFAQSSICFRRRRTFYIWWRKTSPFETGCAFIIYL